MPKTNHILSKKEDYTAKKNVNGISVSTIIEKHIHSLLHSVAPPQSSRVLYRPTPSMESRTSTHIWVLFKAEHLFTCYVSLNGFGLMLCGTYLLTCFVGLSFMAFSQLIEIIMF